MVKQTITKHKYFTYFDRSTGWMVQGSNPSRGKRNFYSSKRARPTLGAIFMFNGDRGSFPEVKWPMSEEIHLGPRLRMNGAVPMLPTPICFHGVERGKFTFM